MTTEAILRAFDQLRQAVDQLEALLLGPAEAPTPANEDVPRELTLEAWYIRRAALVDTSSEAQDRQAALAAGFCPSREAVRDLRARLAPEAWRRPGRRRRRA